jgi:hypothetical protein
MPPGPLYGTAPGPPEGSRMATLGSHCAALLVRPNGQITCQMRTDLVLSTSTQQAATRGESHPRGSGRPFRPGESGNPGGRPSRSKTFAVREYVAEAITDPETRRQAIEQLKANLTGRRSVVPALEFAARVNREIGLGSDQAAGVTISIRTKAPASCARTALSLLASRRLLRPLTEGEPALGRLQILHELDEIWERRRGPGVDPRVHKCRNVAALQ